MSLTQPIRAAWLTVSDRCSQGEATDTSGPALAEVLRSELGAIVVGNACVPDERPLIAKQLREWADAEDAPDLVITTGGTGLAPRDITPEATLDVLDRRHPGLLELARLRAFDQSPRAFLSRGEAGTRRRTLVVNVPGSLRGATETLRSILDILPHAIETLRGEGDHPRRGPPGSQTPLTR